ncbi:hypothetical protein [Deinococcus murrayi]|uniref:hypothetical protein n=1 Tax=Deinococcus murrayi TaxID=68910 RepID=UPI00048A2374|nr:hypothetical protein [Deinococcus murrayi]
MNSENYETTFGEGLPEGVSVERSPRGGNAQRHGILSEYVPLGERAEYAEHVRLIRESTGASTYLEERLADRAALALWRLDRVARYEAAQVSAGQRGARLSLAAEEPFGATGAAVKAWQQVAALGGLPAETYRASPQLAEMTAQRLDRQAAHLERWAAGSAALELSEDDAAEVGWTLFSFMAESPRLPPAFERKLAAALLGRTPTRAEVEQLKDSDWEFQPGELPGMLAYARELWGEAYAPRLELLAERQRRRAAQLREAVREAQAAERDALALAALPQAPTLEKVTRYEAHLERVLYRALHDLEAARREREGELTPAPLRGVLGGQT